MNPPRPTTVVIGQVLVHASATALETAEAVGLADGRVVAVGSRQDVRDAAVASAEILDFGEAAIVPGLCDFHLHLVGMARARRSVLLDEVRTGEAMVTTMRAAAERLPPGAWLTGRGWHDAALAATDLALLDQALGGRPALVFSHDGHSAWASAAALVVAGIDADTPDPAGGRIERDANGIPTGILRERATDLMDGVPGDAPEPGLDSALAETVAELNALGVTAAVDAGDPTAEGGHGPYAALGDSASILLTSAEVDGRLRLAANMPAAAIAAAADLGIRSGDRAMDRSTVHVGWAKAFVDGALGSRTGALFEPYTCGSGGELGITRLTEDELDATLAAARRGGIGVAIHALGDRAVATVLDVIERAPRRDASVPADRMEHLQLMRPDDAPRLAAADITASIQPVHCASDRELVEACWADRTDRAYPWHDHLEAGTRFAFGSDAPIESFNPWLGVHAAVHRRFPSDGTPDWHPEQSLPIGQALAGYTSGAAAAGSWPDRGHLRIGAHADLAVLNVTLDALLDAGDTLARVRSQLTLLGGRTVHSA